MKQQKKSPGCAATHSRAETLPLSKGNEQVTDTTSGTTPASNCSDHEPAIVRIRRLSQELSEALGEWTENDLGGEQWAIHILPPAPDRQSILLENIEKYQEPEWDMAFPTKGGAAA